MWARTLGRGWWEQLFWAAVWSAWAERGWIIPASACGTGWLVFLSSPLIVWTLFPSTLLCYQYPLDLHTCQLASKCRNRSYKVSGGPSENSGQHHLHCIPWSEKVRASPDSKGGRRNVSSEMEKSHCRRAYRMGQIAVTILMNNLPHRQMEKCHEPNTLSEATSIPIQQ